MTTGSERRRFGFFLRLQKTRSKCRLPATSRRTFGPRRLFPGTPHSTVELRLRRGKSFKQGRMESPTTTSIPIAAPRTSHRPITRRALLWHVIRHDLRGLWPYAVLCLAAALLGYTQGAHAGTRGPDISGVQSWSSLASCRTGYCWVRCSR